MIFGSISTQLNTLTKPEPSTTAVSATFIPPLFTEISWTTRRVLETLKVHARYESLHMAQADGRQRRVIAHR